jgi:hypothetical protein
MEGGSVGHLLRNCSLYLNHKEEWSLVSSRVVSKGGARFTVAEVKVGGGEIVRGGRVFVSEGLSGA